MSRIVYLSPSPRRAGSGCNSVIAGLRQEFEVQLTYWISAEDPPSPIVDPDFVHLGVLGNPDVLIIDSWLMGSDGQPRVPLTWMEGFVKGGGQALLLNVDPASRVGTGAGGFNVVWDGAEDGSPYSTAFGDELTQIDGNPRFVWCGVDEMWGIESPYVRESYSGISGLGVNSPTGLLPAGDFLATVGKGIRRLSSSDRFVEGLPLVWGQVQTLGLGHLVTTTGNFTHDSVIDHCPANVTWLAQLIKSLVKRSHDVLGRPRPLPTAALSASIGGDDLSQALGSHPLAEDLVARWREAERCYSAGAMLGCLIMMGGVLEGILIVALERLAIAQLARSKDAPKSERGSLIPVQDWKLVALISVARDTGVLSPSSANYAEMVRDFRNYVHPAKGALAQFAARDAERVAEVIAEIVTKVSETKE